MSDFEELEDPKVDPELAKLLDEATGSKKVKDPGEEVSASMGPKLEDDNKDNNKDKENKNDSSKSDDPELTSPIEPILKDPASSIDKNDELKDVQIVDTTQESQLDSNIANEIDDEAVRYEILKKFQDTNWKILNSWESDRKQLQELIDFLQDEVLDGNDKKQFIEQLVMAHKTKTDQNNIAQRTMDSLTKLMHAINQTRKAPEATNNTINANELTLILDRKKNDKDKEDKND